MQTDTAKRLRISVYDVDLAVATELSGEAARFVYVRDGAAVLRDEAGEHALGADEGAFAGAAASLAGKGTAWLYEIGGAAHPPAEGQGLSLVLSQAFSPDFAAPFLMRADRVESSAGAATPRHGHRGPGIRRLAKGRILAEIGENWARIEAGAAWFESGHEPVIGRNVSGGDNFFVRVMLLPAELKGGKSSFVAADAEEAAKPRSATYRLFGERMLEG